MRTWLERQRYVVDFTLSSLARRKGKNLALLAVYALVVFSLASVLFFAHALRHESRAVLRDAPELLVQRVVAGRHDLLPQAWVATVAGIRGVSGARGRLWGYYFDPPSRANYTVMVPERFWGAKGQLVIGAGVARARGAAPGDQFPLKAADGTYLTLVVREVIPAESELVSADLLLVGEEDFRTLFDVAPGTFTDVAVSVRNAKEVQTVAGKVTRLLPSARPITRSEIVRTYDSILDWRSGLVVVVLAGALLAFVIVAWDKASGLSAEEKREIGILKAIGWETSDVLLMKVWEGAVVSLAAFAVGVLGAYAHVFLGDVALLAPVLRGWSTLYPAFRLVPSVDPYQVATLFFLTVVPYTVATVVPCWRAATIDPDSVMRT
ncbi:MAG TPA: FtsX-like permease family protein [Anaeromyxobacter sp.]|nr:FtsX-like permease family protein [Anaeromyxobacter sp.]